MITDGSDVEVITAVYDTQTNLWDESGGDGSPRFRRIPVPRNPDARREQYSGDDADPIAPLSEEVAVQQSGGQQQVSLPALSLEERVARIEQVLGLS